ncbi:MAG: ATP synthase F1 subunit epsilon [Candidatus Competibacteraceae bacterium]|nr:ATP synthase F1 subunit epsilon [Candidatus Competibacteraceae bacterium]
MQLQIITPDKTLFDGNAKLIQLPGTNGSFELMENHAPIISTLRNGKIKIVIDNNITEWIHINSGVVEVLKNKVIILAEPSLN